MDKTNEGKIPICYAAAYDHVDVFSYLIQKDVDSYELLEDKKVGVGENEGSWRVLLGEDEDRRRSG